MGSHNMIAFIFKYWALILVFFAIVWFVCVHVVADLPDDILSVAYKRINAKRKEARDGGVRDNR